MNCNRGRHREGVRPERRKHELSTHFVCQFHLSLLHIRWLALRSATRLVAIAKVPTLVDGIGEAGEKTATFDGSHLSSGAYFYRLMAGDFVRTRKLVLVR
jgi:hypothetical protein